MNHLVDHHGHLAQEVGVVLDCDRGSHREAEVLGLSLLSVAEEEKENALMASYHFRAPVIHTEEMENDCNHGRP